MTQLQRLLKTVVLWMRWTVVEMLDNGQDCQLRTYSDSGCPENWQISTMKLSSAQHKGVTTECYRHTAHVEV